MSERPEASPRRKRPVNGSAGPPSPLQPGRGRVSITALTHAQREVYLDWNNERIFFRYNPDALNLRELLRLREAQSKPEDEAAVVEFLVGYLSRLLLDWDVVDESGDPYPISEESLSILPAKLLWAFTRTIGDDLNPPEPATSSGSFT
jgi:hypothetical protein